MSSGQDWQVKRITAFSTEDLFLLFWIFYGGAEKKKTQFQKGINNKSSVHLSWTACWGETQVSPSIMFQPLFHFREYWRETLVDDLQQCFLTFMRFKVSIFGRTHFSLFVQTQRPSFIQLQAKGNSRYHPTLKSVTLLKVAWRWRRRERERKRKGNP